MTPTRLLILLCALSIAVIGPSVSTAQSLDGLFKKAIRNVEKKLKPRSSKKQRPRKTKAANSTTNRFNRSQRIQIQSRLNELGYDVGTPDGVFGSKTRNGIRYFQANQNFQQTGKLTRKQFRVLLASSSGAAAKQTASNDTLSKSQIIQLQEALNNQGFSVGTPDGKIGRGTAKGIQQFLLAKGLDPQTTDLTAAYELAISDNGEAPVKAAQAKTEEAASPKQAKLKNLSAQYSNNILSRGLGRLNFSYSKAALLRQKYLINQTNKESYRIVLLNIAIELMNADIAHFNSVNKAKVELEKDERRKPKRQRVKHVFQPVFMEDLLDHEHADKLAQAVLGTNNDLRFFKDLINIQSGKKTKTYFYLSFFDPSRIGDSDPKFYLARNIDKVAKLISTLVSNLDEKIIFNGYLKNISVDPFELKIDLKSPNSFLEVWEWRNGGSSNRLPPFTKSMQIYEDQTRDPPRWFDIRNSSLYTYPSGAKLLTENFADPDYKSKLRIGRRILSPMRSLNSLLAGGQDYLDMFFVTPLDLDINKAKLPVDMLEALSKQLGNKANLSRDLPYLVQAKIKGIESVDGNRSAAIQLKLEKYILFDNKDGSIILELTPDMFPSFAGEGSKSDAKVLWREDLDASQTQFSFIPPKTVAPDQKEPQQAESKEPVNNASAEKVEVEKASEAKPSQESGEKVYEIGGYYFLADDRRNLTSIWQLSRASVCTPNGFKVPSYISENGIRISFISYDNNAEAEKYLEASFCQVIAVPKSNVAFLQKLRMDLEQLERDAPDVTAETIEKVSAEIAASCSQNAIQSSFYKCECVANEYRQRAENRKIAFHDSSSYINNYLGAGRTSCVNDAELLNDNESLCHSTSSDVPNVDNYCLCMAQKMVDKFKAEPRLSLRWIEKIRLDTLTGRKDKAACSKP